MRRREFLTGSAGVMAALASAVARGQTAAPCLPGTLAAQGGTSVADACTPPDNSLARACAALGNGQSADFAGGAQSAFSEADLAWQTAFYHDDVHGLVHLMGKPANAESSWKHQYYTLETGAWTVVSNGMWSNPGHIYGNFTMDFETGDIFQQRSTGGSDAPRRLRWWKYSTRTWGVAPVNQDIYTGAMETHANGVCYHPNLYGRGDGGTIWNEQANVHFWRKSTDARQSVGYSYGSYGDKEGANVYWPAKDACFVGGSSGAALLRITPNATAGGTPVLTSMGRPPIDTAGNSHESGGGFGSLHVHPGNPNKLLLLETAGPRAWETTTGSSWTQIANHPFTRVPRVICSLRGNLGCFWAIGRDASQYSRLWRPAP